MLRAFCYGCVDMQLTRLHIRNLRCIEDTDIALHPGINVFVGDNGAGKTSVLEAVHLMGYGRSFRGRVRDGLIRSGQSALELFLAWQTRSGRQQRAGLRHAGARWDGMLDGQPVASLGSLCAAVKAITFEPGSHALISGGGEARRRFLDWGLFHVEPAFFPLWRRYARTLKQRNALLKRGGNMTQLDPWDMELAETGQWLDQYRQRYSERLQEQLPEIAAQLAPSLGAPSLHYSPGWRRDDLPLADALLLARERDVNFGYTSVGPHRGDWRIRFSALNEGEAFSRGQAKLAALCCLLAQASDLAAQHEGEWPLILLDDLASELDRTHRMRVLDCLRAGQAQVLISGTEIPDGLSDQTTVFHVEHGQVREHR